MKRICGRCTRFYYPSINSRKNHRGACIYGGHCKEEKPACSRFMFWKDNPIDQKTEE